MFLRVAQVLWLNYIQMMANMQFLMMTITIENIVETLVRITFQTGLIWKRL